MSNLIRFKDFEVNARSGELLRRGSKVRLQNQPFQVLMLLLENAGEVVTREELQERVWEHDTFVDFDRGLNKAIHLLRRALRDQVINPRFIENLPRRGYRFMVPVETVEISAARLPKSQTSSPRIRLESVAVLPLENLSGDPAHEYFSDGTTAELISALARIGSARVISRMSAMAFKGTRKTVRAIARQLRVDAIVEGTVTRSDQKVRITAQLIHAQSERLLWSGTFERDLCDILSLQAELAHVIAQQIHRVLEPPDLPAPRVNSQAYEALLKGRFFRDKMTPPDLAMSISFFTQAIELDPTYAHAYGELAQAFFYSGVFGVDHSAETFAKARSAALKAIELDESVATAHNSLAAIHIFHDWDWVAAEAESRRAVELNPGEPVGYVHLADYMSIQGRHDDAIEQFKHALQLDPISRVYLGGFALVLHRARRYMESIAECRKALEIDPRYPNAMWFLALSLEQTGNLQESIATLERVAELSHAPHFRALLGRAYALSGAQPKALEILNDLTTLSQRTYISPFDLAVIRAGLGDLTETFRLLEEAYDQRVFRIIELTFPMFDNLRQDQRWKDLVSRIGLPHSPSPSPQRVLST
jgi:TolB-like protein/lipoprotein NlpI